jgi:hypothetical protein
VEDDNSIICDLLLGTVQRSIYVLPLFDSEFLVASANDNYIPRFNINLNALIINMEKSLGSITKWLKDSVLSVNKTKTEICLFFRHDLRRTVLIKMDETEIVTKCVVKFFSHLTILVFYSLIEKLNYVI